MTRIGLVGMTQGSATLARSSAPPFQTMNARGSITVVQAACPHDGLDTRAIEMHIQDGVAIKIAGPRALGLTGGTAYPKQSRSLKRNSYFAGAPSRRLRQFGAKARAAFELIS